MKASQSRFGEDDEVTLEIEPVDPDWEEEVKSEVKGELKENCSEEELREGLRNA